MRRPKRLPLLAAVLLAALAALLLAVSERPHDARAAAPAPQFPRHVRTAEYRRLEERRTLPPPPAAVAAAASVEDASPPPRRDPFLLALPRDPKRALLVLEANALRHSRLGELFVDCVFRDPRHDPFEEVRRELGFDPLKDVDRVALADDGLVVSGFFGNAHFEQLRRESRVSSYGEAGRVYRPLDGESAEGELTVGTWGDHLVVAGDERFVEQTIDRLEGRAADAPQVIPESLTYGEAYGVLPGDALKVLLRGENAELGERLARIASRIELHADAMRDVAVVARVSGDDEPGLEDLGKAFGAALAVGRFQARVRGDDRLVQLLEHARVERGGRSFSVELALPIDVLEGWFGGCRAAPPAGGG